MSKLKPRERDAIVQALRAGVVPKLGLRHIQVGRVREIEELVKDMDRISDGGSAIRFIIGEYGSGKTFFMNLIRLVALEKGLVVMFADLAPDRRIHATGGQARGTRDGERCARMPVLPSTCHHRAAPRHHQATVCIVRGTMLGAARPAEGQASRRAPPREPPGAADAPATLASAVAS